MENPESWLRELVHDLGQRKVDTIVARDGITGRAMPDPVDALLDIHNAYFRRLEALDLAAPADRDPAALDDTGGLLANEAARQWLLARALAGMAKAGRLKPPDACVLQRIASTCRALEPIVAKIEQQLPGERATGSNSPSTRPTEHDAKVASRMHYQMERPSRDVQLTRQDRAALSKAWELGTDTVALQTVAMLDGDIITRITEQYTGDAYAVVRQIHNEAVETSLSTWDGLVKGVKSLFEGLLGRKA
jgi:hypothetical protein